MNTYVTGPTIRQLREDRNTTQAELAGLLGVSSTTVSKWETAKGLPDITLLQPLAQALGISVIELMNGEQIANRNISANLLRGKFYVCPLCGNIIHTIGSPLVSCCGVVLPPLEAEEADADHRITIKSVEDEHFLTVRHPMAKAHFISFAAFVTCDRVQTVKFYPEDNAQTRMQLRGKGLSLLVLQPARIVPVEHMKRPKACFPGEVPVARLLTRTSPQPGRRHPFCRWGWSRSVCRRPG